MLVVLITGSRLRWLGPRITYYNQAPQQNCLESLGQNLFCKGFADAMLGIVLAAVKIETKVEKCMF
ncbi:hypothetical protein N7539_000786 [Penicillium diatomitis]|uniref:Uncharacterized protein n=1 Tax=Penicillium diatomitis TaxID=2819901 RepID=A0A9X0C2Z3_9EURO|nr:uncharacterized protein N7539_000786 [Penicillium diatomitis]KAJ5495670.1 hypothetical protein N7539_000786 [Penicillium diatomitis]